MCVSSQQLPVVSVSAGGFFSVSVPAPQPWRHQPRQTNDTAAAVVRMSIKTGDTMRRWSRVLQAAACVCAFIASSSGRVAAATNDGSVDAIWKTQQMSFEYGGYGTRYTCRSLQQKLRRVLLHVGANGKIVLQSGGCDGQSGYARFQVLLESPVEATAENIREATTYRPDQILLAHTRGERLPAPEDVKRFRAVWKTVSFARERSMQLDSSDCDLVRALRRQILQKMAVQIVRDNLRCSPGFGNIGPPQLTVSALVPVQGDTLVPTKVIVGR
jgi:hypothetical protein